MADPHEPDAGSMSEALLACSEPLLDALDDGAPPLHYLAAFRTAAMLWNAVVHERVHGSSEFVRRVEAVVAPVGAPPETRTGVARLLESKRREEPLDARWVVDVALVPVSEERFDLRVSGAPASALGAEQVEEILDAALDEDVGAAPPARRRRSGRRKPPAPSRGGGDGEGEEPWRGLYGAARALHALAPWDDHLDSDVFGVAVDGDPAVTWCSVMGAAGAYFGVALYRGDEGFAAYRDIVSTPDGEAASLGYDGFLVSFVDRERTTAGERRRIKSSGVRFRGRGAWPQLDRVRRGRLPRPIDEDDAPALRALLQTLVRALEERSAAGIPGPVDLDGPMPVYALGGRGLDRRREAPRPAPPPPLPAVDQIAVARLRASAVPGDLVLEFDAFGVEAPTRDDDGWEFLPTVYMCVEAGSGFVLSTDLGTSDERESDCARRLLGAFAQHDVLPREVHVARDWVERAVTPTLEALGVRAVLRPSLPVVAAAAAALESYLTR